MSFQFEQVDLLNSRQSSKHLHWWSHLGTLNGPRGCGTLPTSLYFAKQHDQYASFMSRYSVFWLLSWSSDTIGSFRDWTRQLSALILRLHAFRPGSGLTACLSILLHLWGARWSCDGAGQSVTHLCVSSSAEVACFVSGARQRVDFRRSKDRSRF